MAKKVSKPVKKGTPVQSVSEDQIPNEYQTVRGVQYLRPLIFQFNHDGVGMWVPDVINYPDKH